MDQFDKFAENNKGLFKAVFSLTNEERKQIEFEKKNGFNYRGRSEEGKLNFDEIKHASTRYKNNGLCPALGSCSVGVAKFNSLVYKNKVTGSHKGVAAPRKRKKVQLMELEKAKTILYNEFLINSFSFKEEPFVIDDNNKAILSELTKYFVRDETCKLDLNKGICLFGSVGTGKTNLMKQLSLFAKHLEFETAFEVVSVRKVIQEINSYGLSILDNYKSSDFCFDDFAIRKTKLNSYGTQIMPVDEIIQMRYERFTKLISRPTHFTTNIDLNPETKEGKDKLLDIYDERSIDRLQEMCNFLYLGGQSRRK